MTIRFTFTIIFGLSLLHSLFAQKPKAVIVSPKATDQFIGGEIVKFNGYGLNASGDTLPSSAVSWKIAMNHGKGQAQHWHDGVGSFPGTRQATYKTPTISDHVLGEDIFFRFYLIVKDNNNQYDTSIVDLYPKVSKVTIVTNPAGITLDVSGYGTLQTPIISNVPINMHLLLSADPTYTLNGILYKFSHWSDNSTSIELDFTIPSSETVVTANYTLVNAVEDVKVFADLQVYPNITSDFVHLESSHFDPECIVTIYDLMMRECKVIHPDKKELKIDLGGLSNGFYYLSVQIDGQQTIRKLFKN